MPPVSLLPEKFVRLPLTVNLVPAPTTSDPLFAKLLTVVKLRPLARVKLPVVTLMNAGA